MDDLIQISNEVDMLFNFKNNSEEFSNKKQELKNIINLELSDIQNIIDENNKKELENLEKKINNLRFLKKQINHELINLNNSYQDESHKYKFPSKLNSQYLKLKEINNTYSQNQEDNEKLRRELREICDEKIRLNKELESNNNILSDNHKKEMNKLEIKAVKEKKDLILKENEYELKNISTQQKKVNNLIKNIKNKFEKKLKDHNSNKLSKLKNVQNKIDKNNKKKTNNDLEKQINEREINILKDTKNSIEKEFCRTEQTINILYHKEIVTQTNILEQLTIEEKVLDNEYNVTINNLDEKLDELDKYFITLFERNQEILSSIFNYRIREDVLEAQILKNKNLKKNEIINIRNKIIKIEEISVKNYHNFQNRYDIQNDELKMKTMKLDNRINAINLRINKVKIGEGNESLNQQKKYIVDLLKKIDNI
jgi:hypothetical protein